MDNAGLHRGKENVELQEPVRMSEHVAKLREARDARRKRILARSSERLAFITGEVNAIPTSPLLYHNQGNSLISLSSFLNQDTSYSSDRESTIKKSLAFSEDEGRELAHKKHANSRENASMAASAAIAQPSKSMSEAGAAVAQPLRERETMDASNKEACQPAEEDPITLKRKFSNCIKQSLFPRLVCATGIALAFLATISTQGGHVGMYSGRTLGFSHSGHFGWRKTLSMICYSLGVVMIVDLLILMGVFFFFPGPDYLKMMMRSKKAVVNKTTLSILLHLLVAISLDCGVFASLVYGGFLVLSKYCPSCIS